MSKHERERERERWPKVLPGAQRGGWEPSLGLRVLKLPDDRVSLVSNSGHVLSFTHTLAVARPLPLGPLLTQSPLSPSAEAPLPGRGLTS